MMKEAALAMKAVNQSLLVGISGDHCGDPTSVEFFNDLQADYLSTVPSEIPLAKLCASQAHIKLMMEQRAEDDEYVGKLRLSTL